MKGGEYMMNIVQSTGFETLAAPGRSANRNERAEGRGFDSFLAQREAVARQPQRHSPPGDEGQREGRTNGRNMEAVANPAAARVQTAQYAEAEAPQEEAAEAVALLAQELAEYALENPEIVLPEVLAEEILAEIAEALGIKPQVLAEILNVLGMTPVDLLDTQAQTELLQVLQGVEDEVALLNLPATLPIMQEIAKTMEKYAPVLLEYQAQTFGQPQYVTLEEAPVADLDMASPRPDAEIAQLARPARSDAADAPDAEMPVDDVAEAVIAAPRPAQSAATADTQPQQSIEPIVAFAQATEQPIENMARPQQVAPPPQAPVNPQNVMEQIVQHMRFEVRGDMAEIRIQLKPQHLGEVSLRVATQNGIVVAQFVAESQRVKEIIESNFNQLRDALEQQGINISEIEVSVAQGEADRRFGFEGNISGDRIRDIMEGAEEAEAAEEAKLEENLVDYLA
jgi:flagellar hook-length control protein FliK